MRPRPSPSLIALPLLISLGLTLDLALDLTLAQATPALSKGETTPASSPGPGPGSSPTSVEIKKRLRHLARLRQLRGPRVLQIERVSRAELKKYLRATLVDKKRTESTYADEAALLEALLLRRDEGSLLDDIVERMVEHTVIRYDPRRRKLLVVNNATPPSLALSGELCRALIDRRHRLPRFLRPFRADGDRLVARSALVAGDCAGVLVEQQVQRHGLNLSHLSQQEDAIVERLAPRRAHTPYLDALFVAPLRAGLRFTMRLRKRRSWQRINRIYRRPPRTSEQLLHPRLFLRNSRGKTIRARSLRAFGKLRPFWQDTWGELRLRLMLATQLHHTIAARAAAGWDGDRLVAYRREGQKPVVIHLIHWDSEADAFEFDNAMQRALAARNLQHLNPARSDTKLYAGAHSSQILVQRFRRAVLTIYGVKAEEREALQKEVWQRFSIGGRRLKPPK
ncbi:MAG: hypothetical protein JRH20_17160 [Deltaproteobacteria bacterium]|nr:hypothetical protein [Deltaproteobacteria bacterium]